MRKNKTAEVIKAEELCADPNAGGKWASVCLVHGQFVQHRTKKIATEWLQDQQVWCWECQEVTEAK